MQFVLQFGTDNEVFGDWDSAGCLVEIARILDRTGRRVGLGLAADEQQVIRDVNGNTIGFFGHFAEDALPPRGPEPKKEEGHVDSFVGGILLDHGFAVQRVAASGTAWGFTRQRDGTEILVTDENGGHVVVTRWQVGTYPADGSNGEHFEFEPTDLLGLFAVLRRLTAD